jgi:hypothetical protein
LGNDAHTVLGNLYKVEDGFGYEVPRVVRYAPNPGLYEETALPFINTHV